MSASRCVPSTVNLSNCACVGIATARQIVMAANMRSARPGRFIDSALNATEVCAPYVKKEGLRAVKIDFILRMSSLRLSLAKFSRER